MWKAILALALAAMSASCVERGLGALSPSRTGVAVPTVAEVDAGYHAYLRRQPCPDQALCGAVRHNPLAEVQCRPAASDTATCRFVIEATPVSGRARYRCEGQFQRDRDLWHLRGLRQPCQPVPWSLPGRGTIERLERQSMLEEIVGAVGVVDSRSMNRSARVRIRALRCRPVDQGNAACSYEADRCLGGEVDADGDGWCRRETRFVYDGITALGAFGADGWRIDRPETNPEIKPET